MNEWLLTRHPRLIIFIVLGFQVREFRKQLENADIVSEMSARPRFHHSSFILHRFL